MTLANLSTPDLIAHVKTLVATTEAILDSAPLLHPGLRTLAARDIAAIDRMLSCPQAKEIAR
jgi:hypothetical protein